MYTLAWVLLETGRPRARRLLKHSSTSSALTGTSRGSQHYTMSKATCGSIPIYKLCFLSKVRLEIKYKLLRDLKNNCRPIAQNIENEGLVSVFFVDLSSY